MAMKYVGAKKIQQAFNERQLYYRLLAGELHASIRDDNHLNRARAANLRAPYCTRSQMVAYLDQGQLAAMVHQYLQPDGTLGGSGQPDPKWLRVGNDIWKYRPPSRQKLSP
jgi:hypothetical protein